MAIWWLATAKNPGYSSYEELKYRKILAQGWPLIGDLSALVFPEIRDEEKFLVIVNAMAKYAYDSPKDMGAGRVLLNLLKIRENDLVICAEGTTVRGIARLTTPPKYRYDKGGTNNRGEGMYEYAQTIAPVTEWHDWDENIAGAQPPISGQGPAGINHFQGDAQVILDAYEKLARASNKKM